MVLRLSALDKLNLFIHVYINLFISILRLSPWLPFLILGALQALGLETLSQVHSPQWIKLIYPLLSQFLSSNVFHYPQYYLALPSIYSAVDNFIFGPTAGILMISAVVYIVGTTESDNKPNLIDGIKAAVKFLPIVFVVWLIEMAVVFIVLAVLAKPAGLFFEGSPRVKLFLEYSFQLAAFAVSAFLIYTIPGIIAGKRKLITALSDSLRLAGNNFFLSFFLIAIPGTLKYIPDLIISNYSPDIIRIFNPQVIVIILYFKIISGILLNYLIYGSAVLIYRRLLLDRY